jgi:peptidoglycan/LPS O-acetylase OafA/YrhL
LNAHSLGLTMLQSARATTGKIEALTSLRFVTALWVFIFHIHIRWPLHLGPIADSVFRVGAFGMAFFFILSGFILAYRYQTEIVAGRFSYARYLITRFGRIYPNYAFVLLITVPLIDWTTAPVRGALDGGIGEAVLFLASAAALVIAAIFLMQGLFYTHFDFWANGGAWSLSVEWLCYMLMPIVVAACAPLTRRHCIFLFYAFAVVSSMIGAMAVLSGAVMPSVYSHPGIRVIEFVMGVLAYKLFLEHNWRVERPFLIIFLLAAYASVAGFFPGNYILHNFLVAPCIGLIIVAAVSNARLQSALSHRVFIYLGETSYAFYMFQLFVLLLFDRFVPKDTNGLFVLAIGLVVTQAGASLMFHFLEKPAKNWITNWDTGPFRALFRSQNEFQKQLSLFHGNRN